MRQHSVGRESGAKICRFLAAHVHGMHTHTRACSKCIRPSIYACTCSLMQATHVAFLPIQHAIVSHSHKTTTLFACTVAQRRVVVVARTHHNFESEAQSPDCLSWGKSYVPWSLVQPDFFEWAVLYGTVCTYVPHLLGTRTEDIRALHKMIRLRPFFLSRRNRF